jgi:hypothetical protein
MSNQTIPNTGGDVIANVVPDNWVKVNCSKIPDWPLLG